MSYWLFIASIMGIYLFSGISVLLTLRAKNKWARHAISLLGGAIIGLAAAILYRLMGK